MRPLTLMNSSRAAGGELVAPRPLVLRLSADIEMQAAVAVARRCRSRRSRRLPTSDGRERRTSYSESSGT